MSMQKNQLEKSHIATLLGPYLNNPKEKINYVSICIP